MDLLYQRYASPFSFIDGMLLTGRFTEFVVEFVNTRNKELEEEKSWEFYLHSGYEGTFEDFMKEQEANKQNQDMSKRTIETTVQNSLNILQNFKPMKEGGEA